MDNKKNLILFLLLATAMTGAWFYFHSLPSPTPAKKAEPVAKGPKKDGDKKPDDAKKDDAKKKPDEGKEAPAKALPEAAPTEVTIGGDGYHIEAVITSLGAGVRKLTLTKFKAATWLGLPDPDGAPLELIQDDPYQPSFRL